MLTVLFDGIAHGMQLFILAIRENRLRAVAIGIPVSHRFVILHVPVTVQTFKMTMPRWSGYRV